MDLDIPYDVISVVAEHLAGLNAFRSLANLNLASHGVRDETLPILYETATMDNLSKLACFIKPSKGIEYTKYLFCADASEPAVRACFTRFPKLHVIIVVDRKTKDQADHPCDIYIHKPFSTSTLFGVIGKTPVYHVRPPHRTRSKFSRKQGKLDYLCEEEERKPLIRPLVSIQRVVLDGKAYLIPDRDPRAKWTTNMRLTGAVFTPRLDTNKGSKQVLNTVFELLKLAGRQRDSEFLRQCELKQIHDMGMGRQGGWCAHRFPYNQHHLAVEMTKKGWEAFEKRFAADAFSHPEIFFNRLKIAIRADMDFGHICDMATAICTTYASYAMSYTSILPGTGKPHELITIYLNTDTSGNTSAWDHPSMRAMAVRARGKEDDMRLYTEEVRGERELYDEPGESWGDRMQSMREQGQQAAEAFLDGDFSAMKSFFGRTY